MTGGAGFIGSVLVSALLERGHAVTVVDDLSTGRPERIHPRARFERLDVAAPGALAGLVRRTGPPRCLVHLAGRVGVRRVLADPEACRALQVASARSVVEALAPFPGATRVLAASTSEVYAEARGPLAEAGALRGEDGRGRWAYAGSKLAAERLLDAAPGMVPALHLRFFNVVGPGQDSGGGQVLPTFVRQALAGRPLTVHGDGRQVRTFGHVDDVVGALVHLVEQGQGLSGPLNLGGRAKVTIAELARRVVDLAGSLSPVRHVDPRATAAGFEEVAHREPDLTRAESLGIPLRSRGIEAIVADTLAAAGRPVPSLAGSSAS